MTSKAAPIPKWILLPFLIIAIPSLPFVYAYLAARNGLVVRKERESPVRPLRRNRKRALTLPLPESSSFFGRKAQRTYDQLQSRFLTRLSYDIRLMIYEYVLAPDDQLLHVAAIPGRLCGIRCYETDPTRPVGEHRCWWTSTIARVHPRGIPLALLYSCRQMSVTVY